jgi:hypothetical protein
LVRAGVLRWVVCGVVALTPRGRELCDTWVWGAPGGSHTAARIFGAHAGVWYGEDPHGVPLAKCGRLAPVDVRVGARATG